jgi:transposase
MELFEAIRRDDRLEELSIRALAERHGVHRRTVRQALAAAAPPARKSRVFAAPKLDPVKPLIDAMLREDLTAHRKQQHTARRVLARLVDEHAVDDVSYASVRDYVARRRPQIQAEAGRTVQQAFVPQTHAPGEQAEVDFGDVWLTLRGAGRHAQAVIELEVVVALDEAVQRPDLEADTALLHQVQGELRSQGAGQIGRWLHTRRQQRDPTANG